MELEELKGLEKELYPLLKFIPETRDDDMYLYLNYLDICEGYRKNYYQFSKYTFIHKVFEDKKARQRMNVKTFAAVERVRRRLQVKYPELRGKNHRPRQEEQEVYKEYAKEQEE